MFHLISTSWLAGDDEIGEAWERMHHVALHEAQTATNHHQHRADDEALARAERRRRAHHSMAGGPGSTRDLAA